MQRAVVLAAALFLAPTAAVAQSAPVATAPRAARPRGFLLEVDLQAGSPIVWGAIGLGDGLGMSWSISPRLCFGGQLGRFSIGGILGTTLAEIDPDEGDGSTTWQLTFGPFLDYEFWSAGPAGLYFAAALPVNVELGEDTYTAAGFGVDLGIGGRVFVSPWLAMSVQAGSLVDVLFWDFDARDDDDAVLIGWSIYGSLGFRFVAAR